MNNRLFVIEELASNKTDQNINISTTQMELNQNEHITVMLCEEKSPLDVDHHENLNYKNNISCKDGNKVLIDEESLADAKINSAPHLTQQHPSHVKEELVSHDVRSLKERQIYTLPKCIHRSATHIKEELVFQNRKNIIDLNTSAPLHDLKQHPSSNIKEEPVLYEGANLTNASIQITTDNTQYSSASIKGESTLYDGRSLTDPNMCITTDTTHYSVTFIKEEPSLCGSSIFDPKMCTPTDHTQYPSTEIKQEKTSYNEENLKDTIGNTPIFLTGQFPSVQIKEEPSSIEDENLMDAPVPKHVDCIEELINFGDEGKFSGNSINSSTITEEYIKGIDQTEQRKKAPEMKSASLSPERSKNTYICPVCKRGFNNHGNLVRHRETHKGKKMTCTKCGADFCNKTDLSAHVRTHKTRGSLYCSECDKIFASNSHLIIHERTRTGKDKGEPSWCDQGNSAIHSVSTDTVHLSNRNEELDEHTALSYNYTETLSNMEPTPNEDGSFLSQTFQPPREHLQMQYMAGINKSSSYMMEHKHSIGRRLEQPDTGPPSVPCPTYCSKCTKMFATSEAYGCHEPMHLVNIKLFPCTECGKYYRQNTALVIHRRTHTGEKPNCCRGCGRCFNARSSLVTHGKVHSGKKLYSCSECGKNFAKTDDLINHQLVHYRERKYICSDCGKSFKVEEELVAHRNIHPVEELFLCSVCGKDFTQYPKLLRHEKTHPKLPPVFITSERMLKDQYT
ncbi:uncharacterized protein [Dendrobates tinctorius]|uniref:uncharacterized protein n=1 Tax=Dendrobates tinctorius TaxID=92724 RepID=UPI003CC9C15A